MVEATRGRDGEVTAGRRRRPVVVVIVGPTAVGKSAVALALGQRLNGELISADSRQIYRYLDIGTAKPSIEERLLIPHHLVDIVSPDEEYTLADFQEDAYRAIEGALSRHRLPLLVGGTGLYIRAVVNGLRIPRIAPRPELRMELEEHASRYGFDALHRRLQAVDPQAAERIDARNVRRVVRALEVCMVSGQQVSVLQDAQAPDYDFIKIGLTCDRKELYRRIDERVEQQFAAGLVAETQRAADYGFGFELPAMSGLGHRQAALYMQGQISLAQAIEMDKNDTHRFCRQQYNWFRLNDPDIRWLPIDRVGNRGLTQEAEVLVREHMQANV